MKPRHPGGVRIREPRIDPQPPQHERDDERLTRPDVPSPEPADISDGDDDSNDDEPTDNQPEPTGEVPAALRPSGRPSTSSASRRQVRRRDIEHPIPPPEDADERDEDWSAMNWKKSVKELCDPDITVVKRRLRRIHLRWYHATAPAMVRLLEMIGCP